MTEEERAQRIAEAQKRRRKIQRQLKKYEADMTELEASGNGLDTFARGEHRKLYGDDL